MLTELQKIIIGGLKICGLEQDDIVATMSRLQTDEQQWQMADYLESVIESPPSKGDIFTEAAKISDPQ